MSIIREIRVENFRSIKSVTLSRLGDYEPIIGINSAGKSNLLRALKLFFTGTVDERSTPAIINRDYSDFGPKKPRKISVGICFNIAGEATFPRQQALLKKHASPTSFAIKQTWSADAQARSTRRDLYLGPDLDNLQPATDQAEIASLEAFIRAIDFRYVPNHARPSDLIDQYVAPLRSSLVSRLQNTQEYKGGDVDGLLSALSRLADSLFGDVSDSISRGLSDRTLKSALPKDFADLAFDLAIRSVDEAGHSRAPEYEGSGAQQFMFLHLLNLADRTDLGKSFGWLQGHIWAIEEPESFLHSGLRGQYASDLRRYSTNGRRQVFLTTHQDEFVQVADQATLANTTDSGTRFSKMTAREALVQSDRAGITTFKYPLLRHPHQPLVFVEGRFDAGYLRQALTSAGLKVRWRLADPDSFTGDAMGGDAFKNYLRYNASAIQARPEIAPIIVVRDWETGDASQYAKYLSGHPYSTAITMPDRLCNPELGVGWAGIERYLPTSHIESVFPANKILRRGDGVIEPDKRALKDLKQALHDGFDMEAHPSSYLIDLAQWIDGKVSEVLEGIPTERFL